MSPPRRRSLPGGRHASLVTLLTVATALAAVLAPGLLPGAAGAPAAGATAAPADEDQALAITLDSLLPAIVPSRGPVRVTGSVTNRSDQTWEDVNLYVFAASTPLTTPEQLRAATEVDPEVEVGGRVIAPGTFDEAGDLAPGETAAFSLRVPRADLPIPAGRAGVYWFGVHALGTGLEGRATAGRARSFLAQVADDDPQVPVSLVLPLRRPVVHLANGRIGRVGAWARQLETGGRLRRLLDFASAGAESSLTWLIDPAVLAAVDQLAAGNPPRSLAPTVPEDGPGDDPGSEPSGGESASPPADSDAGETDGASPAPSGGSGNGAEPDTTDEPDPGTDTDPDTDPGSPATGALTPAEQRAADEAGLWSRRVGQLLTSGEVLALPWGDLDVAAAVVHDPAAYRRATTFSAQAFDDLGVASSPAYAPPQGRAGPAALAALADGATALLAEDAVEGGTEPGSPVREVAGSTVVLADGEVTAGGPGPDDPLSTVQVRQRLLAEAALRSLGGDDSPMVAVLPERWVPTDPRSFFVGVADAPWLRLAELGAATAGSAETLGIDSLVAPDGDAAPALGAANLAVVAALTTDGQVLEDVLRRNDRVGETVAKEALGSASYTARARRVAWRRVAQRSRRWVTDQLSLVRVESAGAVTLSSEEGKFPASVVNELGEPVTVRIEARTDSPVEVSAPAEISLEPGERTSVVLTARSDRIGLYDVDLVVTTVQGRALGPSTEVSIRSAQVSWIIWVVIAGGGSVLLVAMVVRIVRRVRSGQGTRASRARQEATA